MTQTQTTSACVATPVGNVARILERCEYAEALSAERYYGTVADTYGESIARGRSPRAMLALIERETPAVVIDGAGKYEDVFINASQLRDALSGLPRNATVHIRTGCATDPVVIEADSGTTITIDPLAIDEWYLTWPAVARLEVGS